MSGLTAEGLVIETLETIREGIKTDVSGATGIAPQYLAETEPLGQLIGIVAERLALVWEVMEDVHGSQDPDSATGAAQDQLCALTGTVREAATASTVTLTLTGDDTTEVLAGSQASTSGETATFETLADATLVSANAWAATTGYVVGDRVNNASRVYQCITAGTSAGSGGPTTTSADITDGTAHWQYLGEGEAVIDVEAEATETGPLLGVAGDIDTIITPVSGWSTVTNLLDADVGRNVETDEALRARRELELASAGNAPFDALRADLLAVAGVTSVTLFVNDTDVTDGDGVPPHSVEALIRGGEDQDLWDALLASVAAGIRTHGTEDGTAIDDEGTAHTMAFSRPDEIDIYVVITVLYDADEYPVDGDAQIEAAIVAFGDGFACGRNVTSSAVASRAFTVAGVLDVTVCNIDDAAAPATAVTVPIALRELAVFDSSRIAVTSSATTP